MTKLVSMIMGFFVVFSPVCESGAKAVVDRIEGNYAVVEFSKDDTIRTQSILREDINGEVTEGEKIDVLSIEGGFYGITSDEEDYYQFRSDDDTVWWALTSEEIGHVPSPGEKYVLYYTDNGTTQESEVCDCLPEWECECYLYDDIFFHIEKQGV